MRISIMLLTVAIFAGTGCGGGTAEKAESAGSASPPTPAVIDSPPSETEPLPPDDVTFTSEDLCDFVLKEQDVADLSPLGGVEKREDRCFSGFSTDANFPRLISGAVLFDDAAEAKAQAEELRDSELDGLPGGIEIDVPVDSPGFGLFRQYKATKSKIDYGQVVYYWPVANVVVSLSYNSDEMIHENDLIPYAKALQARVEEKL